ncbi:hypothetical protein PVL30_003216 [Lodderomyces elongisporus]|uniref:uncharacterized protein n=1 Tax=Lodderomyces elongisporus TaxID=36914 RepID=UPI002926F4E7|nr:uncharacterized protein PVL30_003216 [Lodderomyces elongisporus]WLF79461.1 hypothetical protein PVL30_003216 [Lodderomyces elongisporus]
MAGTCINTIKLLGFGSLGLLTSSIIYQSIQNIPQLIHQLNSIYQFNVAQLNQQISKTKAFVFGTRIVNGLLTGFSTLFFSLAFKYSVVDEKHPYLLYAAIGAPLSLIGLYLNAWSYEGKILDKKQAGSTTTTTNLPENAVEKKKSAKFAFVTPTAPSSISTASEDDDEEEEEEDDDEPVEVVSRVNTVDELGRSYVHLSDESGISTPTSTQPSSPHLKQQDDGNGHADVNDMPKPAKKGNEDQKEKAKEKNDGEIEAEIESTLLKKEIIHDLQQIQSGYSIASYISGASLVLAAVGLFGDFYFVH